MENFFKLNFLGLSNRVIKSHVEFDVVEYHGGKRVDEWIDEGLGK